MRRVVDVSGFAELVARPWRDGVNALCWRRSLVGDFGALARRFALAEGIVEIDEGMLQSPSLSPQERTAADVILGDLRALDALGLSPVVNVIASYPRDERGLPVSVDVLSFHVDSAPVAVDSWICTYHGPCTEAVDNDDAVRLIEDPAVRAALRAGFAGDDRAFAEFLVEQSFTFHYRAKDGARAYAFGTGNLWRIAVEWPGCPVPPCIHRAPAQSPGSAPRLLLLC